MKPTRKLLLLLLCAYPYAYGQMAQYTYKRQVKGVSQPWHSLRLPNTVFGKTTQNLADIRIFGVTATNDTVEAPYLLNVSKKTKVTKPVAFTTLNTAYNTNGYYVTFNVPTNEPINQIALAFKQQNFNWQATLAGSQDQKEWFTVLEKQRIVSVKNEQTDFYATTLRFPSTKYRFFRLHIHSEEKPTLTAATLTQHSTTKATFTPYRIKKISVKNREQSQQTEITVALQQPSRVSRIQLVFSDTFEYYRPITVAYAADSVSTAQGQRYNYRTLLHGTLNSLQENNFTFSSTTLQKLKITIHNQNNQSLTLDTVYVQGYVHSLTARFTEEADYFLAYGNATATRPQYDIARFAAQIPKTLTPLSLGDELVIENMETQVTAPLFKNKAWLWVSITAVVLLLGWFSIRMIRDT